MKTTAWSCAARFSLFCVVLLLCQLVWADTIDDAEAKRRGVSPEQVRLERENATLKQTLEQRDKKITALKAQLGLAAGGSAATGPQRAGTAPATARGAASATARGATSAPAKVVTKEAWMAKPPAQWPQIHLSNDVKLTRNRTMAGASAGLIKLEDGRIFGVTARHLMGPAGGIDPALKLAEIDTNVLSWVLRTYNSPLPQVRLGKLATKLEDEGVHDCLILTTTGDLSRLPGLALQPRTNALNAGDKVYLLGCPYALTPYRQNAYPGTVKKVLATGEVDFTLEADLVTRGFSGAPVIDENGHFAGVYSGHFNQAPDGSAHDVYMVAATTVLDLIPPKK